MEVYADNAATTPMSRLAIQTVGACMENVFGNPSSLHDAGQKAARILLDSRKMIAGCLNAEQEEIYFTSGGSEADNQAILSASKIGEKQNKRHILSTPIEHHAVLNTLKKLENEGFEVTLLPVGEKGIVSPADVRKAIRPDTILVSIMYANNEIGTIQPISEIGRICHEKGVLFHTDAVQAAGHLPIDVKRQQIDFMSISAHKFQGPKGTGALYVRKGIMLTALIAGGEQERGKRGGTENVPGIAGMAAALCESVENLERNYKYTKELRDRLAAGIGKIPHSKINGDLTNRLPGNLNVSFEGIEGESLLLMLNDKGIYVSSGSACTSRSLEPSHVLLATGVPEEIAHGSLRMTLSHENTAEEVDYIINVLPDIVENLRRMSPVWKELESGGLTHAI